MIGQLLTGSTGYKSEPTGQVVQLIQQAKSSSDKTIKSVTLIDPDQEIRVEKTDGTKIKANWVDGQADTLGADLQSLFQSGKIERYNVENPKPSFIGQVFSTLIPFLLIAVVFIFLMNSMQGGGSRVMSFAKSKAKLITKDTPKTTFADVAGCDEAIEELGEIKEFLQEPGKFQAVGAKIPKGVLLYGQPGTGKTLLARAVAGEAGVPFYSISGSDFVEMFVGVGASRVRDLFEQAKANAPAIVFIDEIDAVGRHRGAGLGGGHDEREQTLNQLLVEMDGFDIRGGVILIAATNRPDVLDPALLRPGRFDRQIAVDAPDLHGREQILKVHAQGKPMAPDVDLRAVARRTPGFTGADLANVLNEAALLTARNNLQVIDNRGLDEAIDRVIAGPQRRSRLMSDKEKVLTAYHEGGHALVAAALPHSDPVQKVTILPRGRALGYTMVMPDEDKYSTTRSEMLDKLAYMIGGRAAEEMVFHDPTTGAEQRHREGQRAGPGDGHAVRHDRAARRDQVRLGRQRAVPGPRLRAPAELLRGDRGRGRRGGRQADLNAHQEAFDILVENRDVLDHLVGELLERETLDKERDRRGLRPVVKRGRRPAWTGSDPGAVGPAAGDAAADPRRATARCQRRCRAVRSARTGHAPGDLRQRPDAGRQPD